MNDCNQSKITNFPNTQHGLLASLENIILKIKIWEQAV